MLAQLNRGYWVVCAVVCLTAGCVCRDGTTSPRAVALRVEPGGAAVTLKTTSSGQKDEITPDEGGIYHFEIPSLRWSDNIWFGFIIVKTTSHDAEPFLFVLRSDGTTSHLSARQLSRLPIDPHEVSILKVKR